MKSEVHEEALGRLHAAVGYVGEARLGPQIEVKAAKMSQSPFFLPPAVEKQMRPLPNEPRNLGKCALRFGALV